GSRSVPLPGLPSLPTRRSSDLDVANLRPRLRRDHERGLAPVTGGLVLRPPRRRDGLWAHHDFVRRSRPEHEDVLQHAALLDLRVDRKSTRLNSSHVKISYAVFC